MSSNKHKLVQFSDTHLLAQADGSLLGLNTYQSFQDVLALAQSEQPDVDVWLATGDLSQDRTPESYDRFQQVIKDLQAPLYSMVGNHDVPALMESQLACAGVSPTRIDLGDWCVLMLNSAVAGEVAGTLSDYQLKYLRKQLESTQGLHVLVGLHHQPVGVGSSWIDQIMLTNADGFFEVLDDYPQVRGVFWGHVHQSFEGERGGVQLFGCPSTCVQFLPKSDGFGLDEASPGYRWFDLFSDGNIISGVNRLPEGYFIPDHEAVKEGY